MALNTAYRCIGCDEITHPPSNPASATTGLGKTLELPDGALCHVGCRNDLQSVGLWEMILQDHTPDTMDDGVYVLAPFPATSANTTAR